MRPDKEIRLALFWRGIGPYLQVLSALVVVVLAVALVFFFPMLAVTAYVVAVVTFWLMKTFA